MVNIKALKEALCFYGVGQKSTAQPWSSAVGAAILAASSVALAMQSRVDPSEVHQTIDGFGASASGLGDTLSQHGTGLPPANYPALSDAEADAFFSATKGIGLSICRERVDSDGTTGSGRSSCVKAFARGARVIASPWSPKPAYTTNGLYYGGSLAVAHYQDWANTLAQFALDSEAAGAPLYAISIQNEPDWDATPYPSCAYSNAQFHAFVPYLASALISHGAGATKIIIGEQAAWAIDRSAATLADPKTKAMVGIVATHAYSGTISALGTGGKPLWMTEVSSQSKTYDGGMISALWMADVLHRSLVTGGVSAWLYWDIIGTPWDNDNEGLTNPAARDSATPANEMAKRAYALGNWSKFVRPGYVRIGATSDDSNVLVSAFKSPTGKLVIVAVNRSGSSVSSTFTLTGLAGTTMVPWLTSATSNLTQQPSVDIPTGSFTYTLPASSLVTFVQSGTVSPRAASAVP